MIFSQQYTQTSTRLSYQTLLFYFTIGCRQWNIFENIRLTPSSVRLLMFYSSTPAHSRTGTGRIRLSCLE